MKVSKIPGLGRFGIFIDDLDFKSLTDDDWQEIGKLHLQSLVTIIRNTDLDVHSFRKWIYKWGDPMYLSEYRLMKRYGARYPELYAKLTDPNCEITDVDAEHIRTTMNMVEVDEYDRATQVLRVSGKKDAYGKPIGMFAEGELLWHSNESGNLVFTPGVALLASKNVVGSATGFATTVDWYESQSEGFRSELNEMIVVHKFTPGKINPRLRETQDKIMHSNMCPVDGVEIPLVRRSPGGIVGLHFPPNTVDHIKGMTQEDSQKLFDTIEKGIFSESNIYDHWYQNDNDLCIFDNSITQHRRLGDVKDRLCYRIQFNYSNLIDGVYEPYLQQPFRNEYMDIFYDISNVTKLVSGVQKKRSFLDKFFSLISKDQASA